VLKCRPILTRIAEEEAF